MAITYGFFDSVNGDRKYNADQMSEFYTGIANNGVFQHIDNGLAVSAGTGLTVNVATGRALIQKKWVKNDAVLTKTISAASATYARIDAVVIRFSKSNRNISIVVKDGTPAASPAAPSLTRNSDVYEMALAYVNVAANATSVTVTDKRSDTTVCGWVSVAQQTSGEVDAMLNAMKTGFDGVVYDSPAAMVRGNDAELDLKIQNVKNIDHNEINGNGYYDEHFVIQYGSLDTSTGMITPTTSISWRYTDKIPAEKVISFTVDQNHLARVYAYDTNGNWVGQIKGNTTNTTYGMPTSGYSYYVFAVWNNSYTATTAQGVYDGFSVRFKKSDLWTKTDDLTNSLNTGNIQYFPAYQPGSMSNTGAISQTGAMLTGLIPARYLEKIVVNPGYIIRICNFDYAGNFISYLLTDQTGAGVTIDLGAQYNAPVYTCLRICIWKSGYAAPSEEEATSNVKYYRAAAGVYDLAYPADYFMDNVNSAISESNGHIQSVGIHGDRIIFMTDIHWENNFRQSPKLVKYITDRTNIHAVVCGGDLINKGTKATEIANMNDYIQRFNFLKDDFKCIYGNHDGNEVQQSDPTQYISDAEFYGIAQKQADSVGLIYGNYCYFYFDNPTTKTRYICLDTRGGMTISETQLNWVESLLELDDGYKVIIIAHALYQPTDPTKPYDGGTESSDVQALYALCDQYNTKVFCLISGHIHADMIRHTPGNIPVIFTDCDAKNTFGEYECIGGTASEQCFDIFTFDYDNDKIYADRVGRGISRVISREVS